jgi:hypothetical protein
MTVLYIALYVVAALCFALSLGATAGSTCQRPAGSTSMSCRPARVGAGAAHPHRPPMTEPLAELALRTVTVTEIMEQDGSKRLDYEYDDIELWDILGMLEATVIAIKADLQKQWAKPTMTDTHDEPEAEAPGTYVIDEHYRRLWAAARDTVPTSANTFIVVPWYIAAVGKAVPIR